VVSLVILHFIPFRNSTTLLMIEDAAEDNIVKDINVQVLSRLVV